MDISVSNKNKEHTMLKRILSTFTLVSCAIALPVMAESIDDWGQRALSVQNSLDNDAPLNQTTWPGTHNSNSNNDDDDIHNLVLNQSRGLKEQLDEGIRSLVLDVHYTWSEVRVCHNNVDMWGACIENFTGSRKFKNALNDIVEWVEDNPTEVVLLKLELMSSAVDNINKVMKKVNDQDTYYYMPSSLDDDTFPDLNPDGCKDLPSNLTKSKVLASGKNIILYTDKCYDNSKASNRIFSIGDIENAKDEEDIKTIDHTMIIRVKDGATKSGDDNPSMLPSNIASYLDDGINIIETYGYGATGSDWKKSGEYPISANDLVWSWDEYEPLASVEEGTVAILSKESNRFQTEDAALLLRPACRQLVDEEGDRLDESWIIGPNMVTFDEAEAACLLAGNNEYYFATPRNKRELNALIEYRDMYNASDEAIWVNYQKISGVWIADIGEADSALANMCETQFAHVCPQIERYLNLTNASIDF